ncbi:MAG: hypothetical protein R3B47_12010 [Bacteroidia bacterium]
MQLAAGIAILLAGWCFGTTMLKPEMEKLEGQVASIEQTETRLLHNWALWISSWLFLPNRQQNRRPRPARERANGGTMRVLFKEDACGLFHCKYASGIIRRRRLTAQYWLTEDRLTGRYSGEPARELPKWKATCKADARA